MKRALSSLVLLPTLWLVQGCSDPEEPIVATPTEEAESLEAPPVVSGGSLLRTHDGTLAVAADASVDTIFVVDLDTAEIVREIALEPGDEPGRLIEGADGVVYAALRSAGAVARIQLSDGAVTRTPVCAAPRGLEYDATGDRLFVACAGGELATLSSDLQVTGTMHLDRDLRDVVFVGDKLVVSRFRSAEVLIVDPVTGTIGARVTPPSYVSPTLMRNFVPQVAWRMQKLPNGFVALLHQRALTDAIPTGAPPVTGMSYYGGECDQVIVHAAITVIDPDVPDQPVTVTSGGGIGNLVLPVDMAVSPDGTHLSVAAAGSEAVFDTPINMVENTDVLSVCIPDPAQTQALVTGEPISVIYDSHGGTVVQTRQPAGLTLLTAAKQVPFPGASRRHVGHSLFHRAAAPASPIACASCHPEGREDGHVWNFEGVGLRRTQDVSGGVSATKPFHWDGELANMHEFMTEVFVNRMGGVELPEDRIGSLETWLDHLERLPASESLDGDAVTRGESLFKSQQCDKCHAGSAMTNNTTVDVGTGKAFQVPSLVGVWSRAPYMHDGCAATLRDRFDATTTCGGSALHGNSAQLTPAQIDDLVAYLETL